MYIFGNWKMYLDNKESVELAQVLSKKVKKNKNCTVAVFPTNLSFLAVKEKLKKNIHIGAQNCTWVPKGAYTGEVSAHMLSGVDCEYVLVGHSERRHVLGESNDDIRKKLEAVLDAGMTAVLCIGETGKDREEQRTKYRLRKQLTKALTGLKVSNDKIIFAYEPVWAIGTGNACLPADAEDIHGWLKGEIGKYINGEVSVMYGGSVNAKNAKKFMNCESIDGLLIGGASVKVKDFLGIIENVSQK